MGKPKYRRSRYVINRKLQYQLTGTFLTGVLFALLLFTLGFIGFYWAGSMTGEGVYDEFFFQYKMVEKERTVDVGGKATKEKFTTTEVSPPLRRWEIIAPVILANNLMLMLVISFMGIRFSHRIAGPIWNINRSLDLAAQGHLEREIRLRKQDFFHDTAEKMNRVLRLAHLISQHTMEPSPPNPTQPEKKSS